MAPRPFNLIINRDVVLDNRSIIYAIQVEKWNSDRDSHILHTIYTDLDASIAAAEDYWSREGTDQELTDIVSWGVGSAGSLPAGKTAADYTLRNAHATGSIVFYTGWDVSALEDDELIGTDTLSEINWESEYGLTVGYAVVAMKWNAEMERFQ
jgi:hypothetical protein